MTGHPDQPIITVIITTFNHAQFLPAAIDSVLSQDYPQIELIIVDDGSTDDTANIVTQYDACRYIYQNNSGLASARNHGLDAANGQYILFLDADDALLPNALSAQFSCISQHPQVAFVSGGHIIADANLQPQRTVAASVQSDHYKTLLTRNYIGMHAAVLYRYPILKEFRFDTSLSACEDYDMYLRISRKYPVVSHQVPIALYRSSESGMSRNLQNMLSTALEALKKQHPLLRTSSEKEAFKAGITNWKNLYGYAMLEQLQNGVDPQTRKAYLSTLLQSKPRLYIRHYVNQIIHLSNRSSNAGSRCLF